MLASMPDFLAGIAERATRSMTDCDFGDDSADAIKEAADAMREEATSAVWTSDEGKFVLFRMLAVAPWSPMAAPPGANAPLAAALAHLFHSTSAKPHRARPLANVWVPWACRWVHRLMDAWFSGEPVADAPPVVGCVGRPARRRSRARNSAGSARDLARRARHTGPCVANDDSSVDSFDFDESDTDDDDCASAWDAPDSESDSDSDFNSGVYDSGDNESTASSLRGEAAQLDEGNEAIDQSDFNEAWDDYDAG
jgi:hypothetical protein